MALEPQPIFVPLNTAILLSSVAVAFGATGCVLLKPLTTTVAHIIGLNSGLRQRTILFAISTQC